MYTQLVRERSLLIIEALLYHQPQELSADNWGIDLECALNCKV
jgi:hypothetical protein